MNREFLLKISYSFVILSFIIIFGNIEKLNIDIAYGEEYIFSKTWGSAGTEDGQFIFPHSLAIDTYGNIYVTDTGNNRVQNLVRLALLLQNGEKKDLLMVNLDNYMI